MKVRASCVCSCIVLFTGILLCRQGELLAQPLDMDLEERLSVEKPSIDELKSEAGHENNGLKESKEIKYTAGKDNKWFTKDDEVYEYFLLAYDETGRLVKRSAFWEGDDSLLLTKDDVLHDYLVYEYGPDGNISREIFYDGKGALKYTGIYSYDDSGQKIGIKRYCHENKEIGSINYFYGHAGLIVQDVEYKAGEIEKYHRFKYDSKHNAGKVMEYLGSEGGKGKDNVWFTDDDVITSAKKCFYSPDGTKTKEQKYIKPGPDKKWFTKDDVLQYYTIFYYQIEPVK